ncbi:MAG: hypothetical protein AAF409_02960 [Pseudomonadota bacterium]
MHIKAIAAAALLTFAATTAEATPAFYHWYQKWDGKMSECRTLLERAANNVNAEQGDINKYSALFKRSDVIGSMRCLSRGGNKTWVVIIASGDDGGLTEAMFNRMRAAL